MFSGLPNRCPKPDSIGYNPYTQVCPLLLSRQFAVDCLKLYMICLFSLKICNWMWRLRRQLGYLFIYCLFFPIYLTGKFWNKVLCVTVGALRHPGSSLLPKSSLYSSNRDYLLFATARKYILSAMTTLYLHLLINLIVERLSAFDSLLPRNIL